MEHKSTRGSNDGNRNKKNEKVAFYKLFSFADKLDVGLMCVGTICSIANGVSQPIQTIIFGQLINSFGNSTQVNVVNQVSEIAIKYVYFAIISSIAAFLQISCWMVTGERQSARIRSLYLKTILRQDISFFDTETTTGEVIERMSGDTILIQEALGEKVGSFIQLLSMFLGGFIVAFVKGWQLAIVMLGCIPLIVVSGGIMSMILSEMSSRSQIAYAEAGNVMAQTVGAIRTVASFTGEKQAIEKYNDKLKAAYKATVHQGLASGVGMGATLLVIFSTKGLAIWYGSKLIINNGYSGGRVINVLMAIMTGGMSLGQTSPSLNAFAAGQAAAYKMFETIKRQPQIDSYSTNGVVLEDMAGEIELKDVYFRYPARPDVQVFSGFSLHVPSGTTAALVGQSGSGKSTVISLIERFYDPESGSVLIDGINLKEFKLNWIREKIGLVSQEPILFATSIKENIIYGKANATDQEIRTAVELANAAKFIDTLPVGLDTMVGEHGTQLSGGQKQRIAIARVILKNPKILLLDEATSALDTKSERIVQDALVKVMSNRTTVVVAHRLSTIKNADLIAVVQAGRIVEKGVHNTLIRNSDSAYSQLIRLQNSTAESEDSLVIGANKLDTMDIESIASQRSGSPQQSFQRSISRGSSSSRRSLTDNTKTIGVPGLISMEEGDHRDDPSTTRKKPKEFSLKRLAYLNKPELPVILLGSAAAAVFGVLFPMAGFLFSNAINTLFQPPHELRKQSTIWAIVYLCLGIIHLLVLSLQNFMFGIAGGKLIERIRSKTFEKVVYQEISWFDDPTNSSGSIGARLSTDASTIRSIVGDAIAQRIRFIAIIVAALIIAFASNWIMAFIILVISPLMFVASYFETKLVSGFSADAKLMYEEASQVANDAVGGIRTVASFGAENKVMEMYHKKCYGPVKHGIRLGLVSGTGFGFAFLITTCLQAFCFYIGSLLIQHGRSTFKEVFEVFFALTMAAFGLSQTSAMASDNGKAKASTESIFTILDRKSAIDSSNDEGITLPNVTGDIKFEHVTFRYPMRPEVQIFNDLSLTVPSGTTVALVGESGSGKSTVISLIERFYDPDSGNVYLDCVEIQKLKLSWLRQQMGLVSQEPVLFNETIRANIAYGKQADVSEEEIIAAATSSNAHNFISSLPQGYDTNVGERGVQLSGGQKQRIAIARAILKNPKILLLDEATSALDAESERIVQDALDRVMQNRTTVVVAHRLTTIKNADTIAVVKNGVIAENGNHDVLMKITHGAYASLVSLHMENCLH